MKFFRFIAFILTLQLLLTACSQKDEDAIYYSKTLDLYAKKSNSKVTLDWSLVQSDEFYGYFVYKRAYEINADNNQPMYYYTTLDTVIENQKSQSCILPHVNENWYDIDGYEYWIELHKTEPSDTRMLSHINGWNDAYLTPGEYSQYYYFGTSSDISPEETVIINAYNTEGIIYSNRIKVSLP